MSLNVFGYNEETREIIGPLFQSEVEKPTQNPGPRTQNPETRIQNPESHSPAHTEIAA